MNPRLVRRGLVSLLPSLKSVKREVPKGFSKSQGGSLSGKILRKTKSLSRSYSPRRGGRVWKEGPTKNPESLTGLIDGSQKGIVVKKEERAEKTEVKSEENSRT